jgi:transketolase
MKGKPLSEFPMSCQRVLGSIHPGTRQWIGPKEAAPVTKEDQRFYDLAQSILCHLVIEAPLTHASGHPGGPLSSFTFAYALSVIRNPHLDQPLRMSAGHLSLLQYALDWMFGRDHGDPRLASPQAIIEAFRTPSGLPGHVEAGVGTTPFGTGPLGKGVSNALGVAFGLHYQQSPGIVDVLLADGDAQEGQVMEAFRLAPVLHIGNLVVHADMNDVQLSSLPSRTVAADLASIAAACGWHVVEVQNGNDLGQVTAAISAASALLGSGKPVFIAYYTTMGHGIPLMEEGSNAGTKNYHGSPLSKEEAADARKGLPPLRDLVEAFATFREQQRHRFSSGSRTQTDLPLRWSLTSLKEKGYQRTVTAEKGAARKDFGATHIQSLMACDPRIIVLHADLAASGGFDAVAKLFPNRVINVGVAEANMAMMAAGMRQAGLLPITYTFAAFGTNEARANARLIDINCAHTRCAVLHDCTHAGLSVGEDGETHQEQNYLNIPFRHTQVWIPADSNQAAAMAEHAMELISEGHTSVYVFSPRSSHPQILKNGKPFYGSNVAFTGKADLLCGHGDLRDGVTILATGITVHFALAAAEMLFAEQPDLTVRVLNVSCIRPIDAAAIMAAGLETLHMITVEDHNTEGGLASQVADVIADFRIPCTLRRLGLNQFFPSATDMALFTFAGIDAESIAEAVREEWKSEVCGGADVLLSTLHALPERIAQSRFRASAEAFLDRLVNEKHYLEHLREHWEKRTCPREKLPTTAALHKRLAAVGIRKEAR